MLSSDPGRVAWLSQVCSGSLVLSSAQSPTSFGAHRPPRTKFTMLAYAYTLQEAGEDALPFEFQISNNRVGWMIIKIT